MKLHPIYSEYGADEAGNIFSTKSKAGFRTIIGAKNKGGYYRFTVRLSGGSQVNVIAHRFVWECHFQTIPNWWTGKSSPPDAVVIHHKDRNPSNNAISNLQLETPNSHGKQHRGRESANRISRVFQNVNTGEVFVCLKNISKRFHKAVYNKSHRSGNIVYICDYDNLPNITPDFVIERSKSVCHTGLRRVYKDELSGNVYVGDWTYLVEKYGWKFQSATYRGKSGSIVYLGKLSELGQTVA